MPAVPTDPAAYYATRQLALQPIVQTAMETGIYPSRACTPFPQGYVPAGSAFWVRTLGRSLISQHAEVAHWPDGSVKWLHSHFPIEYVGGRAVRSVLHWGETAPAGLPQSPLSVVDSETGITVQTGAAALVVPRPFSGLSSYIVNGQQLINSALKGGPSLIDQDDLLWEAWRDPDGTVELEESGPYRVVIKATGWYQRPTPSATPFCQYVTRITAFAASPLVTIDHAVVLSADMWEHQLTAIGFKIFTPNSVNHATSRDGLLVRSSFRSQQAVWHAQLHHSSLYVLDQATTDESEVEETSLEEKSDGWFATQRNNTTLAMLTRDFWQRYPKEVKVGRNELSYYTWPVHGDLLPEDPDRLDIDQIYKFECFQRGKYFDGKLPTEYYTALDAQTEATEAQPEYARDSNASGVVMRSQFALYATPASGNFIARIQEQQRLFQLDPVASIWPEAVGESDVLGPAQGAGVLSADSPFKLYTDAAVNGTLGASGSIARYNDYGWANYGNVHHAEYMNATTAGVENGRPNLHRVWHSNHYQLCSTLWRLWSLTGDARLLADARRAIAHYSSILQVRYDNPNEFRPGGSTPPRTRWHNPGAFYHCKAFVQWGGRAYNTDNNDTDADLWGHWIDPTSLLLAWLMDGDRWAKDGYDLWRENFYLPNATYRKREFNTTLKHLLEWYDYDPGSVPNGMIQALRNGLISQPLATEAPGPLWEPTWISHYLETFPEDAGVAAYAITSADALPLLAENIWPLALSATVYRLTDDESYLTRHAGSLERASKAVFVDPDPDKLWDNFGFRPGPARDFHFSLQWPRFLKALTEAGLTELPEIEELGHYWCGASFYNNATDVTRRGTLIYAYRATGGDPGLDLLFDLSAIPSHSSTPTATSVKVLSPADAELLSVARLDITNSIPNRQVRSSSFLVEREARACSPSGTGLYKIKVGSGGVGMYYPLVDLPHAQIIRRQALSTTGSVQEFYARVSKGYLLPLVESPITLLFHARGDRDPSYIKITAADQQVVYDGWLRAGTTCTVTMNNLGDGPTPWFVEVFGEFDSWTALRVTASVDEPLLFAHRLDDLNLINSLL